MTMAGLHKGASAPSGRPLGRVMIVDDDVVDLRIYRRIIERSKMVDELLTFNSAEEALEFLRDPASPRVDLMFLDINMPRMTGFEFMEEACKLYGADFRIPVIMMLTTSISPEDRDRAARYSPIREFFNKPIRQDHLQRAAKVLRNVSEAS